MTITVAVTVAVAISIAIAVNITISVYIFRSPIIRSTCSTALLFLNEMPLDLPTVKRFYYIWLLVSKSLCVTKKEGMPQWHPFFILIDLIKTDDVC
jgi:hypothetical protein